MPADSHDKIGSVPDAEDLDYTLLTAIAGRDEGAFATFFDRHSAVVLGFLTRLLHRRDEAEEVLQDVFLQVWRQAPSYRPQRAAPRGWVLMIARSRAIDRLRSRQARAQREQASGEEQRRQVSSGPSVAAAAEQELEVQQALALLSPEQRQCIQLAFFEGFSLSQIADRLQVPLGTTKSRFLYGMRKLRAQLVGDRQPTSDP